MNKLPIMARHVILISLILTKYNVAKECKEKSLTTASGSFVRENVYCKGELIFEDNFDVLNFRVWQHEISLTGSAVSQTK